jgi:ABC-type Zn2+ transport system substrate-binding protein/surface adhesin
MLALSCHVECDGEPMQTLKNITNVCRSEKYNISSITIQIEDSSDAIQIHDDASPGYKPPQTPRIAAVNHEEEHEHDHEEEAAAEEHEHDHEEDAE